jgi:hypothetical protein
MFHGAKQKVTFNCNKDAEVKVNMTVLGSTNRVIEIPRKDLDGLIRVSAPGCETKEMMLPLKATVGSWINIPLIFIPYVGLLPAYYDAAFDTGVKTNEVIEVELNCK